MSWTRHTAPVLVALCAGLTLTPIASAQKGFDPQAAASQIRATIQRLPVGSCHKRAALSTLTGALALKQGKHHRQVAAINPKISSAWVSLEGRRPLRGLKRLLHRLRGKSRGPRVKKYVSVNWDTADGHQLPGLHYATSTTSRQGYKKTVTHKVKVLGGGMLTETVSYAREKVRRMGGATLSENLDFTSKSYLIGIDGKRLRINDDATLHLQIQATNQIRKQRRRQSR